jgi:hypothetical protein
VEKERNESALAVGVVGIVGLIRICVVVNSVA